MSPTLALRRSAELEEIIDRDAAGFRILTGDRPTGLLHLGHYFGTLRNRVRLQDLGAEVLVLIADYQVLTDRDTAEHLDEYVTGLILDYLAIGIDPARTVVFAHSAVPALNQLLLPFLSLVSVPELSRNPTVKDEIAHSRRRGVSGLMLTYPVHQAADILFCKANLVPVGQDQLPHLQLTRVIARRFNERFGAPVFPVPDALLSAAPLLLGTDGEKMSKSRGNTIPLSASAEETAAIIRGAKTDAERHISYDPQRRPEVSSLVLLAALSLGRDPRDVAADIGGGGAAKLKEVVTAAVNETFAPVRARRAEYARDVGYVRQVLREGNERAAAIAADTLDEVRAAMGTRYLCAERAVVPQPGPSHATPGWRPAGQQGSPQVSRASCHLGWCAARVWQGRGVPGDDGDLVARLRRAGVARGDLVGLAVSADLGVGLGPAGGGWAVAGGTGAAVAALTRADEVLRPRWAVWSGETAARLVACGVRLATCWDITAAHRLLFGGWRADPGYAWAYVRGLDAEAVPEAAPPDMFGLFGPSDLAGEDDRSASAPVAPGGYLRPGWSSGGWADSAARMARWAELARAVAELQQGQLAALADRPMAVATARSESAAELLCAELSADGLPMDLEAAEQVLASFIGPRPRSETEAVALRAARDAQVLRHAPAGVTADLRNPAQVRSLLARVGVDVPDTRAWRLRELRDAHPLVGALLEWRKAERIATTYGYAWLDQALGPDGRLRGAWTGSDGAAGRMTASAGLHNMPAVMRRAVVAVDGHVFVRADLGQIEPRVLAAVSGDRALAVAARADDMYAPVAAQLGVDRPTAKVAMIAAMYGQTTGHGAQALRRMNAAYPVAMGYLEEADRAGRSGRDLRTYGGRRVKLAVPAGQEPRSASRAAAYGRYARNAMVQGAAAELFKIWAVTVRARCAPLGARIVLCLHDELLVHSPRDDAQAVAGIVDECLREAAGRWAPGCGVRFIADTAVVSCWSDAKGAAPPDPD